MNGSLARGCDTRPVTGVLLFVFSLSRSFLPLSYGVTLTSCGSRERAYFKQNIGEKNQKHITYGQAVVRTYAHRKKRLAIVFSVATTGRESARLEGGNRALHAMPLCVHPHLCASVIFFFFSASTSLRPRPRRPHDL